MLFRSGHPNVPHGVPVVTGQEAELVLLQPVSARREGDDVVVEYARLSEVGDHAGEGGPKDVSALGTLFARR